MFFDALRTAQWRDKLSQLRAKRNLNNRYDCRIINLSLSLSLSVTHPPSPQPKKEGKPCLITCNSPPPPQKQNVIATDIVK